MNLRGIGASNAQSNQPTFSGAAAPCETAQHSNRRAHDWTSSARLFAAAALAALSFAVPASFAATTTVSVLIDGDNNPSTGCSVATANGAFAGVDRVLNTTVVADGAGYRTQSISLQYCSGGALGVAQVIDSSALPIARGNGTGGTTAVETFVPNSFLSVAGQKMRVGVTSLGSDGLTGSDALTLNGTGPILVDGPPLLIVPTLATASLVLTALLLAGSLWLARRRGWHGMQLVVVMAFALSLSGALIAAIVRDGLIADWTGIAPVATDPTGDAPPGSDITNLYSTVENGNVFFRIDTLLNSPPVANAQTVTAIVGTPLAITLTGVDFEASPLTFTVVTQPTQGVLTGTAPNLTYTPNALATASDSFTFKVNDGSVDSAVATVTIGNTRAPAITSANNVIFIPTQANTFAFASNGIPTPTATFGACSPALPSVTFTANSIGGGTLSGNPTVAEAGVHTCTFTSTNGVLPNATQTFTLTVGGAPTITSVATLSVPELAAFTHTITTSSVLPITGMTSVGALPTGAAFAYAGAPAATASIAGTPAICSRGAYPVTLGVSNSVANATQSFNLTVRPVNQVPSFTNGADVTVLEDATAQTVAGWATARNAGAACESTQTLSFEIVSNSNAALFSAGPAVNGNNGDLTFTPAANANGSATLTVRIKDNGGTADGGVDTSATQSFVINVTAVNDAPSFVKGADVSVLQNAAAQTVTPWATAISTGPADEVAQTVAFQIVGNTNAAMFSAGPAISPTGALTFTPATNQPGTATITVNLRDTGGTANGGVDTSANQTFTITVTAVNQVPSFTRGADVTVLEDAGAQTVNAWATAISPGPASESAQTVAFQILVNSNAALFSAAPAVSPAGVLTYTTAANVCGTATIGLNIKDNGGTANGGVDTSAARTFNITVTCVNDAPVFTKGADVIVLQNAGAQTIANWATGIGPGGGADEAGQAVSFTVSNSNNALFTVQPVLSSTGTLSFTPNSATPGGSAIVTVTAQDNGGTANGGVNTSAAQTFTITVRVAPAITSAAATTFGVGSAGSFTFTASGSPAPTFALTACSPALPASVTAAGSLLSGTPLAGQGGVYNCTLTATNAAGSATQAFALTIAQAPVAVADGRTVLAGATLTVAAPGLLSNDQLSVPPAALTFFGGGSLGGVVTDNAAGASVTLGTGALQVNANGGLSFTPNAGVIGPFTFSYRIANSQGTSDALVTINVNRAPLFTGATTGTLQVGAAGSVAFNASGWPAPAVNTAACTPALPASVTTASTTVGTTGTITFSGTPGAADAGTYSCPLTASNTIAPAATQNVTITIASTPTFTSANSVNFVLGAAQTFNIVTTGIPAATLTNPGGCALPAGLNLSLGAATVSGTATATGTASCNLVATNVAGSANQTLTVNVLQAPSFSTFGPYNLTAGNTAAFSATATGVPLPVITQTAGALPAGITVGSNPAGTINFGGTPTATGTFPITLSATNTASTVTQAATINVTCPAVTVTPTTVSNPVVGTPFSQAFSASGMNSSTFVWTATGLPAAGLSISATTGVVSGTPTVAGPISFTVTATGAAACAGNTGLINTTVNQAPAFTSPNNATFTVGTLGSFTATASGSPAPTVNGSCLGLPSGVTIAGATLSGTPAANTGGSYPAVCTFSASNGVGPAVPQTFSLTVNQALAVTSSASAALALNQPGSFTITTSGFPATNGITLTAIPGPGACVLPTGLTFSYVSGTTATISGTPTTSAPVTCLVTASNGVSAPATQNLTIVAATMPVAVNDSLQTLQNVTLSSSITINDTPGVPPPTVTFGGGSLAGDAGTNVAGTLVSLAGGANNFTIDAAGLLTLTTPPTLGTYSVHYRLTNISGSSDGIITIIVGTAPTLTGVVPGTATVGTPYTVTLTSGGSPVPTTSLQGGSTLPAGISLTGNTLSGTPTSSAAGPFTGSLVATNTFGTSAPPVSYSISVSCPALTVNPPTVADPVINTAYSPTVTFTATGLAGTYTWAATGVPSGMAVSSAGVFSGTPTVSGAQSMAVTGTHTSGCQATRTYAFAITVPPPVVTTSGGTTAFTEDGPAVIVDGGVTPSSAGTTTLASATISISGGFQTGQDLLVFVNAGAITGNYVVASGILSLTGVDTIANYQAALRSITYNNSSQNPTTANRTVSFLVNNGSANSATTTKTVSVTAVNDAPVVTTSGGTTAYLENGAPLAIDTGLTVTDIDSANLTGATIQITGNYANGQDLLSFTNIGAITGAAFVAATGTLTLSGTDTVANYQAALRTVKYFNTSGNPSALTRTVSFQVNDGGAVNNLSNLATKLVSVTPVNDAPLATAPATFATVPNIPITLPAGSLTGTDVDGPSLVVDTVAVSVLSGAAVTLNANGSFTFTPPPGVTGAITGFQFRVCDTAPTPLCSADQNVNFTVAASPIIYFVKNPAVGTANCTLNNECLLTAAVAAIGANTNRTIFISDANSHSANVVLNNGGVLLGQAVTGASFDAVTGLVPPGTGTLATRPAIVQAAPTVTSAATTLTLNSVGAAGTNTVRGITLSSSGGTALSGSGFGTLTASDISISGGLPAISLATGTANATFGSVTSTGGANGINLTTIAGTLNLGSGALSGATSAAFNVSGGTATINYGGSIAAGAGVRSVAVASKTAGSVNLSGAVNGTGTGISLTTNTGATINFTGGMNLSTGANPAFTATGGGTVSATQNNTSIFNTLTTTTGTALNVANTSIGVSNLNFRSISSNGAASGIILNTTGSSGSLIVTGNGGACISAGSCTGGAIQNSTAAGISLTSTTSPSFTRIAIQNAGQSGVNGQQVTNFTLANSFIDNVGTAAGHSNIAFNGSGSLTGNSLSGTLTVSGSTLTNARDHGIHSESDSGTISNVVIVGNTLTSSTTVASTTGSGIQLIGTGNGATAHSLTRALIDSNTIRNFPSGAGIQVLYGNANATGPGGRAGTNGHATDKIVITGNDVRGQSAATGFGTHAILFSVSGGNTASRSQGNADISSNVLHHSTGITLGIGNNGFSDATVTANGNTIVANNSLTSAGISGGNGVVGISGTETPNLALTVSNNTTSNTSGQGIFFVSTAGGGASLLNLKIQNNNVSAISTSGGNRAGIQVNVGNTLGINDDVCLNISGNTSVGSGVVPQGIGLRRQNAVGVAFGIHGMAAGTTATPGVEAYVAGLNPSANGAYLISANAGFSSCSFP